MHVWKEPNVFSFVSRLNGPIKWAEWIFFLFFWSNFTILKLSISWRQKLPVKPTRLGDRACVCLGRTAGGRWADSVSLIATCMLTFHISSWVNFVVIFFQKIALFICVFTFIGIVHSIYLLFFYCISIMFFPFRVLFIFTLISLLLIMLARCLPI